MMATAALETLAVRGAVIQATWQAPLLLWHRPNPAAAPLTCLCRHLTAPRPSSTRII